MTILDPRDALLRPMRIADLVEVSAIEAASFSDPWSPESFRELVQSPHYSCCPVLVLPSENEKEPSRPIGYLVLWYLEPEMHIANVAVHRSYRGQGWGEALIRATLYLGKQWGAVRFLLEVRKSNAAARGLYDKFGFRQIAVRKRYYRNPVEDALVLSLERIPEPLPCPLPMSNEILQIPTGRPSIFG